MVQEPIVYDLYSVEYWFKIVQDSYGISFISHPPLSVIGDAYCTVNLVPYTVYFLSLFNVKDRTIKMNMSWNKGKGDYILIYF